MPAGATGPLACVHCGRPIQPAELYLPAGRCTMGGTVTGQAAALYSDVLEPEGEHLACAAEARGAPDPLCYTVGHGTRRSETFLALLREQGIRLLADIRTIPRPRHNPQFEG
ncbi:MAG TPA: hypothetical protein VK689_14970, partial [Armatimonadota bacterium]|nr:hypothetical protein [Armatimonadota bacterium]